MRAFVLTAVLLVPAAARADSFFEAAGGLAIPVGDSNWTKNAESSPKLALRGGAIQGELGGMLGVDWTPVNLDAANGFLNPSGHRFRVLGQFIFDHHVGPKLIVSGHAGLGIDIAHASYSYNILGVMGSGSDTDVGLAVELGGGAWYDLGSVQIGGQLALPIGHHSKTNPPAGEFTFDYTSYDIDLLFGVRLFMR